MNNDEVTLEDLKKIGLYILMFLDAFKTVAFLAFVAFLVILLTGAMPYSDEPSIFLDY